MNKIILSILFLLTTQIQAQKNGLFTSLEKALKHPKKAIVLECEHWNYDTLPEAFGTLVNLKKFTYHYNTPSKSYLTT